MRKWMAMGLLLFSAWAHAQGVGAVRKQQEASLMVEGDITVDEKGTIAEYSLKDPDKLPPGVETFIRNNLAGWAFEPPTVEGKPVRLRNNMSLLLVAKKVDDDGFLMRVQATSFYPQSTEEGYEIAKKKMEPPRYPRPAAMGGAQGTVYLIVKVGRDGRVQDVVAEQVNLRVVATESMMGKLRDMFADASISAARKWEFTPPVRGDEVSAEYWSIRIPVDFNMGAPGPRYGRWIGYIPGPRQKAPWVDPDLADDSPEAMAAGQPRQLGKEELRLLTPLSPRG
jgi:hypothetical protein